ncbi:MAG: helical backbone metal receptor [Pontiella sp.]
MNRTLFILTGLLLLSGCGKRERAERMGVPQRIISLAPDITEIIYTLGLGDKLVGATTYCAYPEAALSVPRVGGFGQFNFEAIVSLKPDLVILHDGYASEKSRLDGLGIPYLATESRFIKDIMASTAKIGAACGAQAEAEAWEKNMNEKRAAHRQKPSQQYRVLVTFGGNADAIDPIYAFGKACLHNELIEAAGGINVVENNLPFSTLSKEAVIRLNPDIIIQLAPGTEAPDDPSKPWKELSRIEAVKNNRIYILTGDYTCIPGPRFIQILDDFSRLIRPHDLEAK